MHHTTEKLCRQLEYQFTDDKLLTTALTHRSLGKDNNERLEFLGDAILSFLVAELLFNKYQDTREGELSRLRAVLVKGQTLAEIAASINLGHYLLLGPGEKKSGGHHRGSILAGSMEAIIGAVYLDGGIDSCRTLIYKIYKDRLLKISPDQESKDPKTLLQEWLQSQKKSLPSYEIISIDGSDHQQVFRVRCRIDGIEDYFDGEGSSRRRAEQDAAEHALDTLKD